MIRKNLQKYELGWLGGGALVVAAVLGIRYGLLEAGAFPLDCSAALADVADARCAARWLLIESFLHQRLGWLSLGCGIASSLLRWRTLALAGWYSGLAGLVLYSFDPAAPGTLLSLLVLARGAPQHRRRQHEAGDEPGERLRVGGLG